MTSVLPYAETIPGFGPSDFDAFSLPGLDERMAAIQKRIQPKFKAIGGKLAAELSVMTGHEMFLHIARHARRKVNPPKDTWLAICANKRGYKAHPHFQLGLFDDHLFLWFALIYEAPNKRAVAQAMLNDLDAIADAIPPHFAVSLDHTKKDSLTAGAMSRDDWTSALIRLRDVQKAELLVGRHIDAGDPLLRDGEALCQHAADVYEQLLPLYRVAVSQ